MTGKVHKKQILILVETSRMFGRQIIQGISQFALEKGSWGLLLEDCGFLKQVPLWMKRVRFDGIICRSASFDSAKFIKTFGVPIVELLGDGVYRSCDVRTDFTLLGPMAAKHFHDKGFRRFAYFSTGYTWWSQLFHDAYCQGLHELGFDCHTSPFCEERNESTLPIILQKNTEKRIMEWLHKLPKPIGLLCPCDSQAIFILNLCRAADIKVPYEIAVLGTENDLTLCNTSMPLLSSIAADGCSIGFQAARLLEAMIEKRPHDDLPILIPPIGVVTRQSTDIIAVENTDVAEALHYISTNPGLYVTVKEVAEHIDVSLRTLIRKFKEVLKRTPDEEIRRICMERAKTLLHDTNLPVEAIAKDLGYSSTKYFVQSFRREIGIPPHEYRKSFHANKTP